jgi:CRISPR-associated protein Cas1
MLSIYVQNSSYRVRLEEHQLVVDGPDGHYESYPEKLVERLVIVGNAQVTTQAVKNCLMNGTEIVYLSSGGRYYGRSEPLANASSPRRLKQAQLFSDETTCDLWRRALLRGKMQGCLVELRRLERNDWARTATAHKTIRGYQRRLEEPGLTRDQLMGLEAIAAREYYSVFHEVFKGIFNWQRRERHPAPDPINALLSLSSAMYMQELVTSCHCHGLDPQVGFYHAHGYRRSGLALDLLELFRCMVCDHLVIKELRKGHYQPEDFSTSKGSGCRLQAPAFKRFVQTFRQQHSEAGARSTSPAEMTKALLAAVRDGIDKDSVPDFGALIPAR